MSVFQLAPYYQTENYNSASAFEKAVHEKNIEVLLYGDSKTAPVVVSGDLAGMSFAKALQIMPKSDLGTRARFDAQFPLLVWMSTGNNPEALITSGKLRSEAMLFVDKANGDEALMTSDAPELKKGSLRVIEDDESDNVLMVGTDTVINLNPGETFSFFNNMKVVGIEYLLDGLEGKIANLGKGHRVNENLQYVKDGQAEVSSLGVNDYFHASLYQINGRLDMKCDNASFRILLCLEGTAVIDEGDTTLHAKPGNLFFATADTGTFSITGNCRFLEIHLH